MSRPSCISVIAPARLHMGFIDLSGSLHRHFGSIGMALENYATRLSLRASNTRIVIGESSQRADKCLTQMCYALNVSDNVHITVESAIPEHVGLGSGTQMALAIGSALNAFYELGLSVREIAAVMERGLRSGIGSGIFERGGLLVDGGRGEKTIVPPVLVHLPIPLAWRFILVFDRRGQGLHGLQEVEAFKQLPLFPRQHAQELCYSLLMQGLPALAEHDLNGFGEVITNLQRTVGQHFAPAQGGVFTSREVAQAMEWFEKQGAVAIGQTSWGPTGFCAVAEPDKAQALVDSARVIFSQLHNIHFAIVSARNYGGEVIIQYE